MKTKHSCQFGNNAVFTTVFKPTVHEFCGVDTILLRTESYYCYFKHSHDINTLRNKTTVKNRYKHTDLQQKLLKSSVFSFASNIKCLKVFCVVQVNFKRSERTLLIAFLRVSKYFYWLDQVRLCLVVNKIFTYLRRALPTASSTGCDSLPTRRILKINKNAVNDANQEKSN